VAAKKKKGSPLPLFFSFLERASRKQDADQKEKKNERTELEETSFFGRLPICPPAFLNKHTQSSTEDM
jgi:hypothetical protein